MKNADDLKKADSPHKAKMDKTKTEKKTSNRQAPEAEGAKDKAETAKAASLTQLKQQIAQLQVKNEQLQDQYLRSQAEIANMNNHFKKERAELLKYSGQKLAQEILPGIDNLKRALAAKTEDKGSEQLKKGIEMVLKQMNQALEDNEILEISEAGVEFDPIIHQAVSVVEAEPNEKKNMVKQVLQSGYKLKDRVIRPAMVIVTK